MPVVFSSSNQSVYISLRKRESQHIITIRDGSLHPQLVFRNFCTTALFVCTAGPPEPEDLTPRFIARWNWPYKIMPGGVSNLSFPDLKFQDGVLIYLKLPDIAPPHTCRENFNLSP